MARPRTALMKSGPKHGPIGVTITETKEALEILGQLPIILQQSAYMKAAMAAGRIAAARAKAKAPRSKQTGTRELWSKKVKAKRGGTEMANMIRAYRNNKRQSPEDAYVRVWAPLAYLLEYGHVLVPWGRKSASVQAMRVVWSGTHTVKPRPFFRAAIDNSLAEMKTRLIKVLYKELQEEVESFKRKAREVPVK